MFLPWLEAHQQWIKIPHKSSRNVLRAVVNGEMIWTSCENGTLTLSQRGVTPCTARVSPHSRSVLSWKHLCIFSEELSALTERQTLGNIMDKWEGRWMKRWWGECDWLSEGSNIKLILLFFHPDGSYNNVVSVILVHAHSKHTVFFFLTSWFIEWLFSQRAEFFHAFFACESRFPLRLYLTTTVHHWVTAKTRPWRETAITVLTATPCLVFLKKRHADNSTKKAFVSVITAFGFGHSSEGHSICYPHQPPSQAWDFLQPHQSELISSSWCCSRKSHAVLPSY